MPGLHTEYKLYTAAFVTKVLSLSESYVENATAIPQTLSALTTRVDRLALLSVSILEEQTRSDIALHIGYGKRAARLRRLMQAIYLEKQVTVGYEEHKKCIEILEYCAKTLETWIKQSSDTVTSDSVDGENDEFGRGFSAFEALFENNDTQLYLADKEEDMDNKLRKIPASKYIDHLDQQIANDQRLAVIGFFFDLITLADKIEAIWKRVAEQQEKDSISVYSATVACAMAVKSIQRLEVDFQLRFPFDGGYNFFFHTMLQDNLSTPVFTRLSKLAFVQEMTSSVRALRMFHQMLSGENQFAKPAHTRNAFIFAHDKMGEVQTKSFDSSDIYHTVPLLSAMYNNFIQVEQTLATQTAAVQRGFLGANPEYAASGTQRRKMNYLASAAIYDHFDPFFATGNVISCTLTFAFWTLLKGVETLHNSTSAMNNNKTFYITRLLQRRLANDMQDNLESKLLHNAQELDHDLLLGLKHSRCSDSIRIYEVEYVNNPILSSCNLLDRVLNEHVMMSVELHAIVLRWCVPMVHMYHALRQEGVLSQPIAIFEHLQSALADSWLQDSSAASLPVRGSYHRHFLRTHGFSERDIIRPTTSFEHHLSCGKLLKQKILNVFKTPSQSFLISFAKNASWSGIMPDATTSLSQLIDNAVEATEAELSSFGVLSLDRVAVSAICKDLNTKLRPYFQEYFEAVMSHLPAGTVIHDFVADFLSTLDKGPAAASNKRSAKWLALVKLAQVFEQPFRARSFDFFFIFPYGWKELSMSVFVGDRDSEAAALNRTSDLYVEAFLLIDDSKRNPTLFAQKQHRVQLRNQIKDIIRRDPTVFRAIHLDGRLTVLDMIVDLVGSSDGNKDEWTDMYEWLIAVTGLVMDGNPLTQHKSHLQTAAMAGNHPAVRAILAFSQGYNINQKYAEDGNTVAHYAFMSGNQELISTVLRSGASIEIRNNAGKLPAEMLQLGYYDPRNAIVHESNVNMRVDHSQEEAKKTKKKNKKEGGNTTILTVKELERQTAAAAEAEQELLAMLDEEEKGSKSKKSGGKSKPGKNKKY